MRFDYIQEFLEVANTLSFTHAAENLSISQPTLSRHIADLERQMKAKLFERSTCSVRLTLAGRNLYQAASAMCDTYGAIADEIKHAEEEKAYQIVRCGGTFFHPAVNRVFTWLTEYAIANDVPLRFEYGKTRPPAAESPDVYSFDLLRAGKLDFVVEPISPNSDLFHEFDSAAVAREPFVVIATETNPLAGRTRLRIDDLEGQAVLTLALHQHCPELMTYPYRVAGVRMHEYKVCRIADLLEISEHLAQLENNQVVLMQRGFFESFGYTRGSAGRLHLLDMEDNRLQVTFYGFTRKGEMSGKLMELGRLLSEYGESNNVA